MSGLSFLPGKRNEYSEPPVLVDPFDLEPVKAALSVYEPQINELLEAAKAITIVDDGSNSEAVAIAGKVRDLGKQLDNRRKEITEPAFKFKRSIDALVKGYLDRLGWAERDLKNQMSGYIRKQEHERRLAEAAKAKAAAEAQKKLNEEAKKAGTEPVKLQPVPEPEPPKVVRTESGSANVAKVWTFEVVDPDKVPREFLVVDEKKIRQYVKDGCREIAGVRIYEDTQVRIRS